MKSIASSRRVTHPLIMCCALMLCSIGAAHGRGSPQAPGDSAKKNAATTKAGDAAETARTARALHAAQDRAVVNFRRNQERKAATAKAAHARAVADKAAAAEKTRIEARALARAQDRVVAHYKGLPFEKAVRRVEVLTCFTGIQDRHARIGVQLVDGMVNHFSFYSKAKPRTCSIDAARDGAFNHWEDVGAGAKVTLAEEKGVLLIKRMGRGYHFLFRGVDRMRYCGMDGTINGSLTVTRGKIQCDVQGIMDGHQG